MKRYRDITPFLKPCHTLTLGPDYIIPQDLLTDDEVAAYETPRSTVVDGDESMSWSSASSDNNNAGAAAAYAATTTHVVRKKRTGFCLCAKSANSYKKFRRILTIFLLASIGEKAFLNDLLSVNVLFSSLFLFSNLLY
jgi:hypothetical protein